MNSAMRASHLVQRREALTTRAPSTHASTVPEMLPEMLLLLPTLAEVLLPAEGATAPKPAAQESRVLLLLLLLLRVRIVDILSSVIPPAQIVIAEYLRRDGWGGAFKAERGHRHKANVAAPRGHACMPESSAKRSCMHA